MNGGDAQGTALPKMVTALPGPRSAAAVERLAAVESPAFTARRAQREDTTSVSWDPIVWAEATGSNVVDLDGNRYVDLTAGFGAASLGFACPAVSDAVASQAQRLPQALGDLYPSDTKIQLLEALAQRAPFSDAKVVLAVTGSDAVEVALKTAALASGRHGVAAFEGGYHGLSYGAVAACGYSEGFRKPFLPQLNPEVTFLPFPNGSQSLAGALTALDQAWPSEPPGALLVEPIQARGGVQVPPPGFLAALRERCDACGTVLIADEIYTGLGRTGVWFASEEAAPDLICLGKSLGGGFPISACIGRGQVMQAWAGGAGPAIHTGTFYGHPPACAAALAVLDALGSDGFMERVGTLGSHLRTGLAPLVASGVVRAIRGRGLLWGIEASQVAGVSPSARGLGAVRHLLERGFIVLPAGEDGRVIQVSPALTVTERQLDAFCDALLHVLG